MVSAGKITPGHGVSGTGPKKKTLYDTTISFPCMVKQQVSRQTRGSNAWAIKTHQFPCIFIAFPLTTSSPRWLLILLPLNDIAVSAGMHGDAPGAVDGGPGSEREQF